MANKKSEFSIEDAREALNTIESKLEELVDVVEHKLGEQTSTRQRAPKSKVKPVDMPTDIEVDMHDPYNTQPMNSFFHNYGKNHRMFRKDALRNVMKSKMFWIMLITLPMIFTFIEYVLTGWGVYNGSVFPQGLSNVMADMVNWFIIMPLLLMSLIIFPTFIAMSRENNQLKRYSMNGMSRRQIYWSYMRFSIGTLFLVIFIWMGVWVPILNYATDSIWLLPEEFAAGAHVFPNPWSLFFGFDLRALKGVSEFNVSTITFQYNMIIISGMPDASLGTYLEGINNGTLDTSSWLEVNTVGSALIGIDAIELHSILSQLGYDFEYKTNIESVQTYLDNSTYDELTGVFTLSRRIFITIPTQHSGVKMPWFFIVVIFVMFGVNSVGFNKAMRVNSSRSLMGWGIGLWLFASVVQGTSGLLYNDIYKFNSIDEAFWNYLVMVLLFILKWMFIFSPVTIMMVGVSLATGWMEEPSILVLGDNANAFLDTVINNEEQILAMIDNGLISDGIGKLIFSISDMLYTLRMNEYDPLINPEHITTIFISLTLVWAIMWTFKTWLFKSRIVSYEAAR